MRHILRPTRVSLVFLAALGACQESGTDPVLLAPSESSADAVAGRWITRANMPSDRVNTTTAAVTNSQGRTTLYVIGGQTTNSTTTCSGGLSTVQAYNASTNKWTRKAPFPSPIQHTNGAGVIKGKIYLTGGCIRFKVLRGWTWMYDPATDSWTQKASMPVETWGGHTGVIQDRLYVLSGCDGQEDCGNFSNVFFGRYNPNTDRWTPLPLPPSGSAQLFSGSAVIGGKFYVVGRRPLTDAIEVYDPATNRWTSLPGKGSDRKSVASAAIAGKLYMIAGFNRDGDRLATTSVYNPATNTWRNLAPAPRSGAGLAAGRVVVNGQPRIALVGGARPANNFQFVP